MKLELIMVPVSDVDRAKAFYTEKLGFHADFDQRVNPTLRFVQLTPPGSACSIAIGEGITDAQPGSVAGLQMVVADAQAVRDELVKRGAEVSEIEVLAWDHLSILVIPMGINGQYSSCPLATSTSTLYL